MRICDLTDVDEIICGSELGEDMIGIVNEAGNGNSHRIVYYADCRTFAGSKFRQGPFGLTADKQQQSKTSYGVPYDVFDVISI